MQSQVNRVMDTNHHSDITIGNHIMNVNDENMQPPPPRLASTLSAPYDLSYLHGFQQFIQIDGINRIGPNRAMQKIDLVKEPIKTFLRAMKNVSPLSKATIGSYDTTTQFYDGTIDDIIQHVDQLYQRGCTDFIQMCSAVKQKISTIEPEYTPYLFVLTDGQHNSGGTIENLLEDKSLRGMFNMTFGIGNEHDVDNILLKHLSGYIEDAHHVTENPVEIEDIINGGCFEGVTSLGMRNVKIDAIFESDNGISLLGEKERCYLDQSELDTIILGTGNEFNTMTECKKVCDSHFVISSISNENAGFVGDMDKFKEKKIHFFIMVDISGSMGDLVHFNDIHNNTQRQEQTVTTTTTTFGNSVPENHKPKKQYTKVSLRDMANFTQNSNIIIRGDLKYLIINYENSTKKHKCELIQIITTTHTSCDDTHVHEVYPSKIQEYSIIANELENISKISKIRHNFKEIKKRIQSLHNSHMDFVLDIDSKPLPEWFIHQCKMLWEQVTIRYRATLDNGERFLNYAQVTPSSLCRTITASLACSSSIPKPVNRGHGSQLTSSCSISRRVTDTTNMCKICYSNPINMVFSECHHAGTCTECVKTSINMRDSSMNNYECPFCKTKVTHFVMLDNTRPHVCSECGGIVSYFGECKHPISCKKCIKKLINGHDYRQAHCKICNTDVKVMKVFYA